MPATHSELKDQALLDMIEEDGILEERDGQSYKAPRINPRDYDQRIDALAHVLGLLYRAYCASAGFCEEED